MIYSSKVNLNIQFYILCFTFCILHSQFYILHFSFNTLFEENTLNFNLIHSSFTHCNQFIIRDPFYFQDITTFK